MTSEKSGQHRPLAVLCRLVGLSVLSLLSWSAVACDLPARLASIGMSATTKNVATAVRPARAPTHWSGREDSVLVGFWLVNMFDANGTLVDQIYKNVFADHNEFEVDQTPPNLGNTCNGTWVQSGAREFKVYHPSWQFDPSNGFAAFEYIVLRETLTVSKDGETFTGSLQITVYNLDNSYAGGPFDFTYQGKRLKVDF